ncbi:MAG: cytochrome c-type biogenesis protein CcmH [Gammaproteobacteria bacterium]|nr:cytochrome c-type biogenesis protein CcmH [Gammaproteobacteria bacterium]
MTFNKEPIDRPFNWLRLGKMALLGLGLGFLLNFGQTLSAPLDAQNITLQLEEILQDIRCLVCQNESLASSQAALAQDLRNEIKNQLVKGASVEQIHQFLQQRYGDFILYKPPYKPITWALWLAPLTLLIVGLLVLLVYIKKFKP